MAHRHPLLCVVPPYILENILRNGTDPQKDCARRNLQAATRLRTQRHALHLARPARSVGEKRRTIYDARNTQELPGTPVRREGDPASEDAAVNEAYDGSGTTYDFYSEIFGRNSIDDRGLPLDSTVHYDRDYDNAFWNGRQMVYGDGDGQIFNRFTLAIDVIGHELTHGVTQYEANLAYRGQSGALSESFSDVFGAMVKQFAKRQTVAEADWLIGEGLFTARVKGVALRSMKAPGTAYDDPVLGKDPQPDNMKNLYRGQKDNGGVHINSGIPNKAFYLAASALSPEGYAWEKAGPIWYEVLRNRLKPKASFADCAKLTVQAARDMFGTAAAAAVEEAWGAVGVIAAARGAVA